MQFWAAGILLVHIAGSLRAWLGVRGVTRIADMPVDAGGNTAQISVVVAARDEAQTIRAGLLSLMQQTGVEMEILVVDDRSTDGTGEVIEACSQEFEGLKRARVDELPPGWLGKNNALAKGAAMASGEYLLFTDADIVFAPDTVQKVLGYAQQHNLDHLTAAPGIRANSWVLALLVGSFAALFGRFTRAWRVSDPKSKAYIGIGALNLVRRNTYEALGGHEPIRMRVDDDLSLGKLLKRKGFAQDFVIGGEALTVEWYQSLRGMVLGLEKNAFAGLEYSVLRVLAVTALLLTLFVVPFAALGFGLASTTPFAWANLLWAGSCAAVILGQAYAARDSRIMMWPSLLAPVGVLMILFVIWRSMVVTLKRGGVIWRGTLYPLADLRRSEF